MTPFDGESPSDVAVLDDVVVPTNEASSGGALHWVLAVLGITLLGVLIYRTGARDLVDRLRDLGWWTPVLFLPYALASAFDAAGWGVTFARRQPPLWLLYLARLTGEALNNVTPTAYLGGEPVKAYLLRRFGVPIEEGAASVILAKSALTISQIAFVLIGVALLMMERDSGWSGLSLLVAMTGAGLAITIVLVRWQQRGLLASAAHAVRTLLPRLRALATVEARAAAVDGRLRSFYAVRPRAAVSSVGLHLVGWLVGAAEVFAIMALLDHPVRWQEAIIIDALSQPIRLVGILIPGALGVQEAGGMIMFGLLGLPPELGLAMMLLKRVREIGFSALGLGLLARLRPR